MSRKESIGSRLTWTFLAVVIIAVTVAGAWWTGRPTKLVIDIPKVGLDDDLRIDNIRNYIQRLTRYPSRMSGSAGAEDAFRFITGEMERLGVSDYEVQSFDVAVPVVTRAVLRLGTGPKAPEIPLHPLWPNLVRTSQTPPEGLTGPIVDVGRGTDADLAGKAIRGSIVVMDSKSEAEWLSIQEFGGKAVIFRANPDSTGNQARKKFLTVPANIPRFYIETGHLAALDAYAAKKGAQANLQCDMEWRNVTARNIFVRLTGGNPLPDSTPEDLKPVIFHTYYDSISVVPDLAPGAEQACGAATLLELARYIKNLGEAPTRPIYLLFTGAHGQALGGITHFTRKLSDGLRHGWAAEDADSLLARMGEPSLMIGLDLSSRSHRMGLFAMGRFRQQYEHLLRPKFAELGLKLDKYARDHMTDYDEESRYSVHTKTPFVDCINLTLGRGWWTYFPYQSTFESEIPTLAGIPAVTLGTINDDRPLVDTPEDRVDRLDFDLLEQQLTYKEGQRPGLAKLMLAFAYWRGPFISGDLEYKMGRVQGRTVWLNQEKDYTPNRALAHAVVALKTYRADKYLMGTRGMPVVISDDDGNYVFDGLIDVTANAQFRKVEAESYGIATRDFLDANPEARREYLRILRKGGQEARDVAADGSIMFAVDQARPGEYPFATGIMKEDQYLNLVNFPCKPITLYGLLEPRGFNSLTDLQILDASTESPPYQWGVSKIDVAWGDPEENCMSVWADPTLVVRLTLGFGLREKRLVLLNNSPEDPIGKGYVLSDLETVPSWVLQGAQNMLWLDDYRINQFESNGVTNPRVTELHGEATRLLAEAKEALENRDYATYRTKAERGWALESSVYNELLGTANNMIKGVLFYLLLLLPFSYCLERLVFASGTIKGRIIGMLVVFSISFIGLAMIHPAFRFTMTPLLVLLAFIILSLAVSVSLLILGKFDALLQERKQAATGTHEDSVAVSNVAIRAIDLGIANIRRRPQRAWLTGTTIVLVTFTLLSFTSVVPEVSISRLKHPDGKPVYRGLLTRDPHWNPMPNPLYDSLRRSFLDEVHGGPKGNVLAGRAWYFSDYAGNLSQVDLLTVDDKADAAREKTMDSKGTFTAVSLIGLEPDEVKITDVASTLVAGRWFKDPDEKSIILPEHVAENLGLGKDDLGTLIRVFGQELPLVGILDGKKFDELRDIDGEPLTPVNFQQQLLNDAASETVQDVDTLKEYVHWPTDRNVFVPFKFCRSLGGTIRSVAILSGPDVTPGGEAEEYARRSNLTILASEEGTVTLFASMNRSRMTGAAQIIIPLILGFIMVLGTMLGSVYERRREIFVYNSVGLSPKNVASLFLAESGVYAIIGASVGYLLGQAISKGLLTTGLLSGLSLNYSASTTVIVTLMTMGIVLISTIYPARQAFLSAIPEQRKRFDDFEDGDDEATGDSISLFLPFVATPGSVFAMQAYMEEYLDSVQGVSVGRLAVDDLKAGMGEVAGQPAPVLHFRAWLAPFDLGISHDAALRIVFREDRGVFQYHLTATRHSGDQQNWRRLTPWFIMAVRKQLLMWRILTPEDHEKYMDKAERLFGQRTISEDPTLG